MLKNILSEDIGLGLCRSLGRSLPGRDIRNSLFVSQGSCARANHFSQIPFLARGVFGLVLLRRACFMLVKPFSIGVFSPSDKRGEPCVSKLPPCFCDLG